MAYKKLHVNDILMTTIATAKKIYFMLPQSLEQFLKLVHEILEFTVKEFCITAFQFISKLIDRNLSQSIVTILLS